MSNRGSLTVISRVGTIAAGARQRISLHIGASPPPAAPSSRNAASADAAAAPSSRLAAAPAAAAAVAEGGDAESDDELALEGADTGLEAAGAASGVKENRAACVRLVAAPASVNQQEVPLACAHGYHSAHKLQLHRVQKDNEFVCDLCGCSVSQDIHDERALYERLSVDDPHSKTTTALIYLCVEASCRGKGAGGALGDYLFGLCYACCRYDIGGASFRQWPASPRTCMRTPAWFDASLAQPLLL